MSLFYLLILLVTLGYYLAKAKITKSSSATKAKSLPIYYGICTSIWSLLIGIMAAIILHLLNIGMSTPKAILIYCLITTSALATILTLLSPYFNALKHLELIIKIALFATMFIAVLTTVGIVYSVLFESIKFFQIIPIKSFLFGTVWDPQAEGDPQTMAASFGVIPVFLGTFLVVAIALAIAIPIGILSSIYFIEYAHKITRNIAKPIIEMLSGIPTVVYGYFAVLSVAPAIKILANWLGFDVSTESALIAGLVMGIMIIPLILSLTSDALQAVPKELRFASLAIGATRSETIKQVIIPAAMPGIISAILLALARAIGETMIVVMAAGLTAKMTANPFASVTTVTVQIVNLLVGDQEFDNPKTLAAFALGLTLFIFTLGLNLISLYVAKHYKNTHE